MAAKGIVSCPAPKTTSDCGGPIHSRNTSASGRCSSRLLRSFENLGERRRQDGFETGSLQRAALAAGRIPKQPLADGPPTVASRPDGGDGGCGCGSLASVQEREHLVQGRHVHPFIQDRIPKL
jgi:hypothetical protein